jgi:hypothetical protein
MRFHRTFALFLAVFASCSASQAQIPDLLNAFDAGGRSLGMGGSLHGTDPSSMSAYYNPASLGYVTKGEVDLALHHLPNSTSTVTNTRSDPSYNTQAKSGQMAVTDVGVAMPVKPLFGKGKASVALSYNIGGYVHDRASSGPAGLGDGDLTLANYMLARSVRSDFITLAYGQSVPDRTLAFGLGIIYAQTGTLYNESAQAYDSGGNSVGFAGSNFNYQSHGVGFIVGGQFIPASVPNFSLGVSYRSPIGLNAGDNSGIYDRIPSRLLADASYRFGGSAQGADYAILAAQYQYFFDADSTIAFQQSTQSVYGLGIEYDHTLGNFRVPVRIGYESASAGGVGFEYRDVFTYGIGLRPTNSQYTLDFNWSTMEGGGKDFGISAGYRFGK